MELDELKTTWMALETQLKKNETLNKKLLLEMLQKKSNKSLSKLRNSDFISVIVFPLLIPFGVWLCSNHFYMNYLTIKILAIVLIMMSVIGLFWFYKKLKYLMKIDVSKSIKDNMYCVNKYTIMIKQEKVANYCVFMPIVFFLITFWYYEVSAPISLWAFLIACMMVGTFITIWSYKKTYDPNIQAIKKGLNELKELND